MVTKKDDLITIELPQKGYLVMAQDLFVTQWNTGQKLAILGVTDGTEVEFGNEVVKETLRRQIIDGVVAIPDIMLTYTNTIFAYVEMITANSQTTKYKIVITVEEKTKPSDYIYPEDEPTFREEMQALLDAKQDKLIAGDNITIDENNKISATGGGTSIPTDYVPTTRKVANKELKEDITGYDIINSIKDLTDFWIAVYNAMAKDTNVTNFFSLSSVLEAINKIFYNKYEVENLLNAITTLTLETVKNLPTENISTLKIYLVPKVNADGKNNYEEWINLDGTVDGWEFIGTTEVDLTNYVQTSRKIADLSLEKDITITDLANNLIDEIYEFLKDFFPTTEVVDEKIETATADLKEVMPTVLDAIEIEEECVGALTFANILDYFNEYKQLKIFGFMPYTETNTSSGNITIAGHGNSDFNVSTSYYYFQKSGLQASTRLKRLYFEITPLWTSEAGAVYYDASGIISESTAYSPYTNTYKNGTYPNNGMFIGGSIIPLRRLSIYQAQTWAVGTKFYLLGVK